MFPIHDDQPTRSFPAVTLLFIGINTGVFALWQQQIGLEQSVKLAALVPADITTAPVPRNLSTIFTSMFMHGSWLHLLGNMWFLWIFGNNIEDATSHLRFLFFYLFCGIAAVAAHILFFPGSATPLVGASGAVSGVLGAYLVIHPLARIRTLFIIIILIKFANVPAWIFLLLWIGFQILSHTFIESSPEGGGVAYLAHIAGFFAGLLLIFLFRKR